MTKLFGTWQALLVSLALAVAAFGAGVAACSPPESPPDMPTPSPQAGLSALPRGARIAVVSSYPDWNEVGVWELPGVTPGDRNSAAYGNRGQLVGSLTGGAAVTVTGYQWSQTDRDFYVYVKTESGVEGWVPLSLIDLDPP